MGVLTYELLTGSSPFTLNGEKTQQEISRRILRNDPLSQPSYLSDEVWDFITRLLVKDPRRRLGGGPRDAKDLKEHPFFMNAVPGFSWEALENKRIKPPIVPKIAHELDTSNFSDEFTKTDITLDSPAIIDNNVDNNSDKHFRVSFLNFIINLFSVRSIALKSDFLRQFFMDRFKTNCLIVSRETERYRTYLDKNVKSLHLSAIYIPIFR